MFFKYSVLATSYYQAWPESNKRLRLIVFGERREKEKRPVLRWAFFFLSQRAYPEAGGGEFKCSVLATSYSPYLER